MVKKVVGGEMYRICSPSAFLGIGRGSKANMPYYHTLASILDVNGDGVMEVITRSQYYEGDTLIIHEIKGTTVTTVLTAGLDI